MTTVPNALSTARSTRHGPAMWTSAMTDTSCIDMSGTEHGRTTSSDTSPRLVAHTTSRPSEEISGGQHADIRDKR
jgi:hypothetical protein